MSLANVQGVKAEEAVSTLATSTQVESADISLFASNQLTETPTCSVTTNQAIIPTLTSVLEDPIDEENIHLHCQESPSNDLFFGVGMMLRYHHFRKALGQQVTEAAKSIRFLLLDESKTGDDVKIQPNNYKSSELKKSRQLFV